MYSFSDYINSQIEVRKTRLKERYRYLDSVAMKSGIKGQPDWVKNPDPTDFQDISYLMIIHSEQEKRDDIIDSLTAFHPQQSKQNFTLITLYKDYIRWLIDQKQQVTANQLLEQLYIMNLYYIHSLKECENTLFVLHQVPHEIKNAPSYTTYEPDLKDKLNQYIDKKVNQYFNQMVFGLVSVFLFSLSMAVVGVSVGTHMIPALTSVVPQVVAAVMTIFSTCILGTFIAQFGSSLANRKTPDFLLDKCRQKELALKNNNATVKTLWVKNNTALNTAIVKQIGGHKPAPGVIESVNATMHCAITSNVYGKKNSGASAPSVINSHINLPALYARM